MTCKWNGRENPRTLLGRHGDDCPGETCSGCAPCTEPHCRVCSVAHHEGTCAECMAATRADLHEIARLCGALPEEVEHRGVNSEAMMLWGPVSDPEARGHVEAAYLSGRLPEGWIEAAHGRDCPLLRNDACVGCAGGERHPTTVLLSWQMVWRDALEHSEAHDSELVTGVDYLDQQLTYMGGYEHVPFEDFARDLRRCVAHLEAVLHDGEQVEATRVPCTVEQCQGKPRLVVAYGSAEKEDHYRCPACKTTYQQGEYARAKLRLLVSTGADRHVRMQDARDAIARPERTWRKWIRFGHVRTYRDTLTGQVWVWWPDVREAELATPRRQRIA